MSAADDFAGAVKRILAVIVLYKVPAEKSQACASLWKALNKDSEAAGAIELVLCDNTPYEQARPAGFDGLYVRDGRNYGLARRYNQALGRAEQGGMDWLMLLDQDTTVTAAYLREALERSRALARRREIVAIVPKLVSEGLLLSPHVPLYAESAFAAGMELAGVPERGLQVFNSGALLRTSRLVEIGGFPEHFWLDYLDHATFHLMQREGGKVFVMDAVLEHELSPQGLLEQRGVGSEGRRWNTLQAAWDYFERYGTRREQRRHWRRMVRMVLGLLRRGRLAQGFRLAGILFGRDVSGMRPNIGE